MIIQKTYEKEPNPVRYFCEFTHGENVTNCEPWQNVPGKHSDAWDAVVGAMEWLEWNEMDEKEKESIFIKLWRSDHVLIGNFDAEEIEEISCGKYEPWKEF